MSESQEATSSDLPAAPNPNWNKGVKKGLPQEGLADAVASATSLWEVARLGLAAKKAFADKLGRKSAAGGSWDQLVAQLRGFGLVRQDGEQIGLSTLGQQIVNGSDPRKQIAARREALLLLKAYRELVESFDGTSLPDKETLASRLKFEYGKSNDFASKAAQAFLDSLVFAEMVDSQGRVQKDDIGEADVQLGDAEDDQSSPNSAASAHRPMKDDVQAAENEGGFAESKDSTKLDDPRTTRLRVEPTQVTLAMSLDLSKYTADEVVQILRAIKS